MKLDEVKWGGSLLLTLGLMAGSAWAAWEWQANAHGRRLAIKETAHLTERTNLGNANSEQIMAEQGKRLALEQWLAASDQSHYRALTDEKTKQARLRDRLATADLRLSVLLDATGAIRKSSRQVSLRLSADSASAKDICFIMAQAFSSWSRRIAPVFSEFI